MDTRKIQWNHFLCNNPHFVFPSHLMKPASKRHILSRKGTIHYIGYDPAQLINGYSYNLTVDSDTRYSGVLINILEYHKYQVTNGGSAFTGTSFSNNIMSSCSYMDYFNGSYSIFCPIYSQCSFVEISLELVNYTQFKGITKPMQKTILSKDICVTSQQQQALTSHTYWRKTASTWKLNYYGGSYQTADVCDMLKFAGRIYFFGASHLQHTAQYYLKECAQYIPNLRSNMKFSYTLYVSQFVEKINSLANSNSYSKCNDSKTDGKSKPEKIPKLFSRSELHRRSMPKLCLSSSSLNTSIMLQLGTWDMAYTGLKPTLEKYMPKLEGSLKRLMEKRGEYFTHLLIVGPPPLYPTGQYAYCRNDVITAIFSTELGTLCQKYEIPYINTHDIIYPRYNETPISIHYLKCIGATTCKGDVGKILAQVNVAALVRD